MITDGWKYSDGSHWIDANQENIMFLDFTEIKDGDPPLKLKLQLSGEAKNIQWKRAGPWDLKAKTTNGIYSLASKKINGYPYWIHEDQDQAIWFNKISKAWFIGDIEDLGENVSGISGEYLNILSYFLNFSCNVDLFQGPKGEDDYPSAIVRGWKYAKQMPIFVEADEEEIVLSDYC